MNESLNIFIQPWKTFIIETFLFSLTLILGITAAFRIVKFFEIQEVSIPQMSLGRFILNFLLATLFIFLIAKFLKFKKGKAIIFKILFSLSVFLGGSLLVNVWIPDVFALTLMAVLILFWLKKPSVFVQDLLVVLGIAGAGSVLGLSLSPLTVIAFLIIFSIYDWISVYKTKHMIKMAKEMIESKAILGLVIPPDVSNFKSSLETVQPGGKFLILGGGDIVFPLLFCSSLVREGVLSPLIVAIFSLIGLFAGFYFFISQKTRQPIPALPPIAFFSILGYLISKIIKF